jgi:hypothetical protein
MHASQISATAVLWRRLQLQGDCEHLRWLRPPQAEPDRIGRPEKSAGRAANTLGAPHGQSR